MAFVPSGCGAPRRSMVERRPLLRARGPPGSPCAEFPPPDLLAVDLVDFLVAGAVGASGVDDGAGWRPLEVRASKTSRPSGGGFRSKVPRKLWRRRVFDTASSSATATQKDLCDSSGKDVDLSTYKGKVLLIVNVASQCGLTNSNYTELSQLYEKYKDQGFEILAFPCNQFGGQEPGTNEEIVQFACTRFKAEYPIFDKVDVNGNDVAPIYKFLKTSKGSIFGDNIKWNFAKFLVDKEGRVVDRYAPTTSPLSIEKDLKKLLASS